MNFTEKKGLDLPGRMNIRDRVDETDIDIENFIEFKWFIKIYQITNP